MSLAHKRLLQRLDRLSHRAAPVIYRIKGGLPGPPDLTSIRIRSRHGNFVVTGASLMPPGAATIMPSLPFPVERSRGAAAATTNAGQRSSSERAATGRNPSIPPCTE